MEQQPRISLRDIAARAGVTAATVSLALRNSPEISAVRRRSLKKLAEKMGYRPDPALTALSEYRRQRRRPEYREHLAFLYQTHDKEPFETWSNWPVRRELVTGMRERAGDLGYGFEIHDFGVDAAQQKRIARMLRTRGIRGVMVHPNLQPPEKAFSQLGAFATLNVLQFSEKPTFHSIRSNDYEAMRTALIKLYQMGYRNPLYIRSEPRHGLFGPDTMGGFDWFMSEYQDVCCRSLYFPEFEARAVEILDAEPKVDVILIHDYRAAEQVAKRIGLSIPERFGVCYLFTSPELPHYGGIDVQARLIGRKAVESIDLMLRHNEIGPIDVPTTLLVHPIWQNGPSLPPRPARQKARRRVSA